VFLFFSSPKLPQIFAFSTLRLCVIKIIITKLIPQTKNVAFFGDPPNCATAYSGLSTWHSYRVLLVFECAIVSWGIGVI